MEQAYDDAKYGRFSAKPYIDMIIPTLVDPSMAPPGKHVDQLLRPVRAVPPRARARDVGRPARGVRRRGRRPDRRVRAEHQATSILFRNVQTPLDIERTTGLTEGNIFQGELTLEQLFFNRPDAGLRPVPDARSATSGCAARRPTPAAGSWARTAGSPRSRCCARAAGGPPDDGARRVEPLVDAIVVGGGHNGLVTAAYLAKRRPADRSSSSGGTTSAARPRPPSSAASACRGWRTRSGGSGRRSSATSTCRSHGLRLVAPDVRVFAPQPDGRAVTLWTDQARTVDGLRAWSTADADA